MKSEEERDVAPRLAQGGDPLFVEGSTVAAVHGGEDLVGAGLHGQVQVGCERLNVAVGGNEGGGKGQGVGGGVAQAAATGEVSDGFQKAGEVPRPPGAVAGGVGVDILAEEGELKGPRRPASGGPRQAPLRGGARTRARAYKARHRSCTACRTLPERRAKPPPRAARSLRANGQTCSQGETPRRSAHPAPPPASALSRSAPSRSKDCGPTTISTAGARRITSAPSPWATQPATARSGRRPSGRRKRARRPSSE